MFGIDVAASAFGLCVNTPSPTTPTHVTYPFVPATSYNTLASPVKGEFAASSEATASSPIERITRSSRTNMLRSRPIARASNPMLAATFRAQGRDLRGQSSIHAGRFNSEFVIVQSLGRGEFSQVWKVREKTTGNVFAIKAGKTYTGYKHRYAGKTPLDWLTDMQAAATRRGLHSASAVPEAASAHHPVCRLVGT